MIKKLDRLHFRFVLIRREKRFFTAYLRLPKGSRTLAYGRSGAGAGIDKIASV